MSLAKTPLRIGLFALLLGVIVLSLFESLLVANHALASADREAVNFDAHGAALVAERELRLRAEALKSFVGALLRSKAALGTDTTGNVLDAVWILDDVNRVAWRRLAPGVVEPDPPVLANIAREAAPSHWPIVRALNTSAEAVGGGILVGAPLMSSGTQVGSAVGFVRASRIFAVLADSATKRSWLALRAGGRTVAATGMGGLRDDYIHASAAIRLPGDVIEVEVAHAETGRTLRTTLWLLDLVAVVALLLGLARERRQALSLRSRTAELEGLYQEVARSNRMKSEFLANVSHELRTPLNAVVGFVEMLREGVYGELTPRQALPVDRIAASATHLRHLVDRLLDIAKIAAGRLEVHSEPLVLRPFVLNVASEMESLVSARGLALSIAVGQTLPRIRTDQTHLRQILINLIGNAIKYTPSGSIKVQASLVGDGAPTTADVDQRNVGAPPDPDKRWVALQVCDTGVGIAKEDQERIFDEFEQVNAGARTDSARRGTGLGLAISRRLAHLLGGELSVASEPGRGSVFTVWLPIDAPER